MNNRINASIKDISEALVNFKLPIYLAYSDIRQRYRRSSLGPFWITLSTAIMIATIGLVFGGVFKASSQTFLPYLTVGLITWGFVSNLLNESANGFISSEAVIKQLPLPLFTHILRLSTRNCIIFFHNIVLFPLVCLIVQKDINFWCLLFFPNLILLLLNLLWASLLISIICTRFRDLAQIIASLLQVAFYVTPIIWMPSLLPEKTSRMLIEPNPLYHLIEIIRSPLMGGPPSFLSYVYSVALCITGWCFTLIIFNKYRNRIAYWL